MLIEDITAVGADSYLFCEY